MTALSSKTRAQRQGVEICHYTIELTDAASVQAQHGFVKLHMRCQDFFEVGFCYAQNGGLAV